MQITTGLSTAMMAASIMLLPLPSLAQTTDSHAPPNTEHTKRFEGTVSRVDGNELLLKAKGGTTETYQLSPAVHIVKSRPGLMSDLSSGKFVSCSNLYGESEKKVAEECRIFPDGMQGFPKNPGASEPTDTSATDGTITNVQDDASVQPGKGRRIMLQISHQGSPITMAVSPVTKVTVLSPGDASGLKPGVKVTGVSQQAVDGTGVIQTIAISSAVHKD